MRSHSKNRITPITTRTMLVIALALPLVLVVGYYSTPGSKCTDLPRAATGSSEPCIDRLY